ncbi:hypothetical protein FHY17_002564 [Xanthomonas arboricola]|uniref:Uncharacterized protein n=1 Tax=Xanthomonas arboricola TaxID=56448 RepID=A0AB73GTH8_9XANT|nr:hypothetical protein [Xanthomonas arboricola]MBB4596642.1 hypothetical protein [Xanthomonas arboricola]MBB4769008.1 hypothetical protein [Xanthomonas arboricola]MBB5668793.1 hypothetical protein [Xanthomonas arboricola]
MSCTASIGSGAEHWVEHRLSRIPRTCGMATSDQGACAWSGQRRCSRQTMRRRIAPSQAWMRRTAKGFRTAKKEASSRQVVRTARSEPKWHDGAMPIPTTGRARRAAAQ